MSKIKYSVLIIITTIIIEIAVVLIAAYSGIPDIAATKPEGKLMSWFLNTVKDHSISTRARNITAPSLNDSSMLLIGYDHYNEMCVTCHGAPGRKPDELAQGLNPFPPDLALSTRDMDPSEMFIVVKDGIKMTGMPGFGPTHSDTEVWAMVAFLKHLQTMSADEYAKLNKAQNNTKMEEMPIEHKH